MSSNQILTNGIESFLHEDRNGLKNAEEASIAFSKKSKRNKEKVYSTISKLANGTLETSHFYVQMIEHQREMSHAVYYIV